jgi:hypothetical protein
MCIFIFLVNAGEPYTGLGGSDEPFFESLSAIRLYIDFPRLSTFRLRFRGSVFPVKSGHWLVWVRTPQGKNAVSLGP